MSDRVYSVLFLCSGNSARSIFAEAILNELGGGRFRAYSAGSQPAGAVHPLTLDVLKRLGMDTESARSKSWDEFAAPGAPEMDFIFTVCDSAAGEACPSWPGRPMTAHWGVPDPVLVEGSPAERHFAFAETFRVLRRRIELFVNLPLQKIDRLSLRQQLNEIGTN
jgi:protein-tyrosine-phosphatase